MTEFSTHSDRESIWVYSDTSFNNQTVIEHIFGQRRIVSYNSVAIRRVTEL
jgi:hypothetical protein